MSLDAVTKFWEKVVSDKDFQSSFLHATRARTVAFAADHGFEFSEDDLKAAADQAKARVEELRSQLQELGDHELEGVVGGAATTYMSSIDTSRLYNRIGEILDLNLVQS